MKGIKILCVAAGLIGFSAANAQTRMFLGGTLSPQLCNFASDYGTFKPIMGAAAGASMELRFNNKFSIQIDPMFSMQGANRQYTEVNKYYGLHYDITYDRVEHFNDVAADLLFKFNFPIGAERIIPYDDPEKPTYLTFFLGGYGGYVLAPMKRVGKYTQVKYVEQPPDTVILPGDSTTPSTYDQTYSQIDFGIKAGAGVQFKLSKRSILEFNFSYTRGLASIDNGSSRIAADPNTPLPIGYGHMDLDASSNTVYTPANVVNSIMGLNISYRHRFFGKD